MELAEIPVERPSPPVAPTPLTYRILSPDQWPAILEIAEALGKADMIPPPETAGCAVAETTLEDGSTVIVGFLLFQLAFHMEPLVIHPQYRGTVNFLRLVETLESELPPATPYYVFSPSKQISGMCKLNGMDAHNFRVWSKSIPLPADIPVSDIPPERE